MTNKDLLNQYVNIGNKLPEYQVKKLSPGHLKSYLRRRLQQSDISFLYCLEDYEYLLLPEEEKDGYLERNLLDNSQIQATKLFRYLSPYYRRKVIDKFPFLYKEVLRQFSQEDIDYLFVKRINLNHLPNEWEFGLFSRDQKEMFMDKHPKAYLFDLAKFLPQDLLIRYMGNLKRNYIHIPKELINRLSKENLLKLNKEGFFE